MTEQAAQAATTKDRDSCRVALERIMTDLPIADQIWLMEEWLWQAFDWAKTPDGHGYWGGVVKALRRAAKVPNLPQP